MNVQYNHEFHTDLFANIIQYTNYYVTMSVRCRIFRLMFVHICNIAFASKYGRIYTIFILWNILHIFCRYIQVYRYVSRTMFIWTFSFQLNRDKYFQFNQNRVISKMEWNVHVENDIDDSVKSISLMKEYLFLFLLDLQLLSCLLLFEIKLLINIRKKILGQFGELAWQTLNGEWYKISAVATLQHAQ